jgi:YVTN family beta-propeller protein
VLYDATGNTGAVDVWSTDTWRRIHRIELNGLTAGANYAESFAANLALSRRRPFLYVLDQGNWRVVVIDTAARERIASIPTGANPLAMALSEDGKRLYFTNSGLFEYQLIQGRGKKTRCAPGCTFRRLDTRRTWRGAAFKRKGIVFPASGNENDIRGKFALDLRHRQSFRPVAAAKLRLGSAIHAVQRCHRRRLTFRA